MSRGKPKFVATSLRSILFLLQDGYGSARIVTSTFCGEGACRRVSHLHLSPEKQQQLGKSTDFDPGYIKGVSPFYSLLNEVPVQTCSLLLLFIIMACPKRPRAMPPCISFACLSAVILRSPPLIRSFPRYASHLPAQLPKRRQPLPTFALRSLATSSNDALQSPNPMPSSKEAENSKQLSDAKDPPPTPADVRERLRKTPRKRVITTETRRKISYAMLGRPKSEDMRAKVSEKLKGRVPWNKGKKLSPETRARMSEARFGRSAWNKGRRLSAAHREALSRASLAVQRSMSAASRHRIRMARRRPGDALVAGSGSARPEVGNYPLVDSAGINAYVTLRRELRVWSDKFVERNDRRPTLADIRRVAPVPIMRKFEKYAKMRDNIRGLASDVYGSVDPADVPVIPTGDVASAPRNNNSATVIHVTKHGNPRLVSSDGMKGSESVGYSDGLTQMEGALDDMWDKYDRPESGKKGTNSSANRDSHTLIGAHELNRSGKEQLSASDYRKIGKYRLMETMDINRYMALRKELQRWSASFRRKHGRTPTLSDARRSSGRSMLYYRFCEYLQMRDSMSGLVQEVYGTEVDDVETLRKVNVEGKTILDALRAGVRKDERNAGDAAEES